VEELEAKQRPQRDKRREKERTRYQRGSKIHDNDIDVDFTLDWLQRNMGNVKQLYNIINKALY
jgi:hypothetical protein